MVISPITPLPYTSPTMKYTREWHNVLDKNENDKNKPETKPIEISIISNKIVKSNSMGINKSEDLAYYAIALDRDDKDKNTHETKQIEIHII